MAPPPTTSPDPPKIAIANPGQTDQYWLRSTTPDALQLWTKRWYPLDAHGVETAPKSCTVFCHGFVEYAERYREIFQLWPARGHEVVAFDQRGWGQTMLHAADPVRSYGNATWPLQFEDLEAVLRQTRGRLDERWGKGTVPLFSMGQSMGGGIVLAFQTRSEAWRRANRTEYPSEEARDLVQGTIAIAPWLRLTEPPNWLLAFIGQHVMSKIPGMPWWVDLKGTNISRDPVVAHNFENDRFCQKKVYLKTIAGPLVGGPQIVERDHVHWPRDQPLLILHGTGDLVTDWRASEQLVQNITSSRDKELKKLDGYYHDVLMEPGEDKIVAATYIIDWIEKRC